MPNTPFDFLLNGFANPLDTLLGATEVYRGDDKVVIRVDMPGVDPGAIDISVANGKLSIMAEREPFEADGLQRVPRGLTGAPGSYRYDFPVGHGVDTEAVGASYDAGVLTVTLPVSEKAKSRKVPVISGEKAEPEKAASRSRRDAS